MKRRNHPPKVELPTIRSSPDNGSPGGVLFHVRKSILVEERTEGRCICLFHVEQRFRKMSQSKVETPTMGSKRDNPEDKIVRTICRFGFPRETACKCTKRLLSFAWGNIWEESSLVQTKRAGLVKPPLPLIWPACLAPPKINPPCRLRLSRQCYRGYRFA